MWSSEGVAAGGREHLSRRGQPERGAQGLVMSTQRRFHRETTRELLGTELEEWKTLDLGIKLENSLCLPITHFPSHSYSLQGRLLRQSCFLMPSHLTNLSGIVRFTSKHYNYSQLGPF